MPGETPPPPGPAVLETIEPWKQPRLDIRDWQIAFGKMPGADFRLAYRVPLSWDVDSRGRARSGDGEVQVSTALTTIRSNDVSLAAYAAQLAEDAPIFSRTTRAGYPVYLMTRTVSVAPSDPNVEAFTFHTAVVEVNGRVAKLEVRYDADLQWRYGELGRTIIGTLEVRPQPPA